VVLPEPMNPARQTMEGRDTTPRGSGNCVTIPARTKLIAPQDANCTTEGRELDFGKARADAAEKAVRVLGGGVTNTVCIRFEKGFGAIVHSAEICLGVEVERIRAGEADFDDALAALHRIDAGAKEISVVQDVAGSRHDVDAVQRGLKNLCVAADGRKFEFTRAERALQRTARTAHDDVAGNFFQGDIAGDAFELHIAHDLLDVDQASLGLNL